jgi:hypothetical protein
MRIDFYTKSVLTIIAACLVWMVVGSATPPVQAQDRTPSRVIVTGWEDQAGFIYKLPEMPERMRTQPVPLPVRDAGSR